MRSTSAATLEGLVTRAISMACRSQLSRMDGAGLLLVIEKAVEQQVFPHGRCQPAALGR